MSSAATASRDPGIRWRKNHGLPPEVAERALQLYRESPLKVEEIAAELGIKQWRLMSLARATGARRLPRAPLMDAATSAEAVRLYAEEGLTGGQVAERLGLHRWQVERHLHCAGVMRSRAKPVPPDGLEPWSEAQIRHCVALARTTVERMPLPILPDMDVDDYEQVARLAALKALATYDRTRGATWQSWVIKKVRFALKESLRQLDPCSRSERHAERQKREAAAAAGEEPEDPRRMTAEPLSSFVHKDEREETQGNEDCAWEPSWEPDVEAWLLSASVKAALAALPERDAFVVRRLAEGYEHAEIGRMLGVSEGRCHQLAVRARERLAELLEEWR